MVEGKGKRIPIRLWNELKIAGTHGKYSSLSTGFEIVGDISEDQPLEDLAKHQDFIVSVIQKLQNHTCVGSNRPAPWAQGQPSAAAQVSSAEPSQGETPAAAPQEVPEPTKGPEQPTVKRKVVRRKVV